MQATDGVRENIMRLFYILRGIVRGCNNSKTFNLFFDWFYPHYFSPVIEGALNAFYTDDEVVLVTLKFLTELVLNRQNRVRFDTWNINGLIVFKETAKYAVQLLKLWDCFRAKQVTSDPYKSKWKHIKQVCNMYLNMIAGNYVNFAICEYYNDSIFTQLSQLILTTVSICDYSELISYEKVHRVSYTVVLHFFNNHLELLFSKFENNLIDAVLDRLLQGLSAPTYEVQADCCVCINNFNEWVLEKLSMNSMKHQNVIQSVQEFCKKNGGQIFQNFLNKTLSVILFEECLNSYIFQKVLFSTMVIVNQQGCLKALISNLLNTNEKNDVKRKAISEFFIEMLSQVQLQKIDQKSKEMFGAQFNKLRSLIYNL